MKYDTTIERQVKDIKYFCDNFLQDINVMNQCAYTDRLLDHIEEKCNIFIKIKTLRDKEMKKMLGE